MSERERSNTGDTGVNEAYLESAGFVRQKVANHLQALGLPREGIGIAVHQLDDRHPNELFDPESQTFILVHSEPKLTKSGAASTEIHIVTKEILVPSEDKSRVHKPSVSINTTGLLINHFGVTAENAARLRYHGELYDQETDSFRDRAIGGPVFSAVPNEGEMEFSFYPKSLRRLFDSDTEPLELDDRVFNTIPLDMFVALGYASTVLEIISEDTVYYQQSGNPS